MPEYLIPAYRWTAIGGHLALDLCNTVSWRLDPARRIDRLGTGPDLISWFEAVSETGATAAAGSTADTGPIESDRLTRHALAHPAAAERALRSVKELRDASIRVLDQQLGLAVTEPGDVDQISAAWRRALAVAGTREQLPWRWRLEPVEPGDLVHVLALSVADLLHRPDPSRLRRCDGDGCGWLFLDTTRNHSRRWCDPLDCGNRARVRSYVERHRKLSR